MNATKLRKGRQKPPPHTTAALMTTAESVDFVRRWLANDQTIAEDYDVIRVSPFISLLVPKARDARE